MTQVSRDELLLGLKALMQDIVGFIDSGADQNERRWVRNGDLCNWYDRLEVFQGIILHDAAPAQSAKSQAKEPEASGGLCAHASHAVQVGEPTRIGAVVGDQVVEEPSLIFEALKEWQDARRDFLALPPVSPDKPVPPAIWNRLATAEQRLYGLRWSQEVTSDE